MDIKLLKCFCAVAEEMHFGRAAHKMDMLPSALGRNIKILESLLGTRLFSRTTRNVILTSAGHQLLNDIRPVLEQIDSVLQNVRLKSESTDRVFRIGAIDSAATGLIPQLLHDFRQKYPDVEVRLEEDKTIKLLPKLETGALDLVFVRPPLHQRKNIYFEHIINEPAVVALPSDSPLAKRTELSVYDLVDLPLIVPSPRSRPHSFRLTNSLFINAGLIPNIVQQAEEKHTIVNMVAANVGGAIIPYWTSRINVANVVFRPLISQRGDAIAELPLAAGWLAETGDVYRDHLIFLIQSNLQSYSK